MIRSLANASGLMALLFLGAVEAMSQSAALQPAMPRSITPHSIAPHSIAPHSITAHSITIAECMEGGEFIRNAALARDAGITRDFFISRLEEDLMLIRAFPPHLRWFAQDEADEQFLSERARNVFDAPMKPEEHEASFVHDCITQSAVLDPAT